MAQCQAAAGLDKTRVALRYGDGQAGGHQRPPSTWGDRDVGARTDVGAGIAGTGVIGKREVRVELDHLHHQVLYHDVLDHDVLTESPHDALYNHVALHVPAGHSTKLASGRLSTAR